MYTSALRRVGVRPTPLRNVRPFTGHIKELRTGTGPRDGIERPEIVIVVLPDA